MPGEFNYCPRCGHALAEKSIEDRPRPYCPSCGYVVFLDPKLAVVVLISVDANLVMVRRATEPALGRWSFPSGYVDRGEPVEDAGKREVMEETGLDVRVQKLVGLYSARGREVVLAAYSADVVGAVSSPATRSMRPPYFRSTNCLHCPFRMTTRSSTTGDYWPAASSDSSPWFDYNSSSSIPVIAVSRLPGPIPPPLR